MAGICSYGVDGAGVGFHLGNQGAIVDFPELQEPRPAAADKALTSRQEIQGTDPVFVSIRNRLHRNTHTNIKINCVKKLLEKTDHNALSLYLNSVLVVYLKRQDWYHQAIAAIGQ